MVIFAYLYLTIAIFIQIYSCNIWDNMFSHLESPYYDLSEEFKIELKRDNKVKATIYSSYKYSLIKISLLDQDIFNSSLFNNNSTAIDYDILDIYIDFYKSRISLDFSDYCNYTNVTGLKFINPKFLTSSYDFLTYYREGSNYLEYLFTNPLALGKFNKDLHSLNNPLNDKNELLNMLNSESDIDTNIKFNVDKSNYSLVSIELEFQGAHLGTFEASFIKDVNFEAKDFLKRNKCNYFEVKENNINLK